MSLVASIRLFTPWPKAINPPHAFQRQKSAKATVGKAELVRYFREAMVVFAVAVVVVPAVLVSWATVAHDDFAKEILFVLVILGLAWIGAIATQAKDVAGSIRCRSCLWKQVLEAWNQAHSDERLASSFFGLVQWTTLAIAAMLLTRYGKCLTRLF